MNPCHRLRAALVLLALALQPALAGPSSQSESGGTSEAASGTSDEVDTENLFGFTEGSDTGKKGEQEILLDSQSRFGKRRAGPGPSHYGLANIKLSYQYDPTDAFTVEFGLFGDLHRVRNIPDLSNKSAIAFDGVEIDLKYQFLKGSDTQPLGLAIETRPRYARVLPVEGQGADIFDIETLLQIDYRLVPDTVWYGGNLSVAPSAGRLRGSGEGYRSSTLLWSNVVMTRIAKDTFIGPEVRYLRSYDGSFLNRFEGHAVTLGPVLYHRFFEKAFVTLAYAAQVAGHDRDPSNAGRAFDLRNFERHAVRVKIGVEF